MNDREVQLPNATERREESERERERRQRRRVTTVESLTQRRLADGVQVPRVPERYLFKYYRDLWGGRIWREWRQRCAREAYLIAGDASCAAIVSLMLVASGMRPADASVRFTAMAVVLGQALMGTYRAGYFRRNRDRIVAGVGIAILLSVAGVAAQGELATRVRFALAHAALLLPALFAFRGATDRLVKAVRGRGAGRKRTLIIGSEERAHRIVEHFRATDDQSLELIGRLSEAGTESPTAMGTTDDLPAIIEKYEVEHVLVAEGVPADEYRRIANESLLRGATIGMVGGLITKAVARTSLRDVAGWPALQLRVSRPEMLEVAFKRLVDLTLASIALVCAAPVMLIVAVLIRLDSPGPVLFAQRRPGLGGRAFRMLKFRTMRTDAESILDNDPELYRVFVENGCKFPDGADPRISRIGRVLRETSLDELPQLFNVLRGDMSLVGPRPVLGPEFDACDDIVSVILSVKPGMTGLWQVSGRSAVAGRDRAALDVEYVSTWSLMLDANILARTIPAVVRRAGAR